MATMGRPGADGGSISNDGMTPVRGSSQPSSARSSRLGTPASSRRAVCRPGCAAKPPQTEQETAAAAAAAPVPVAVVNTVETTAPDLGLQADGKRKKKH